MLRKIRLLVTFQFMNTHSIANGKRTLTFIQYRFHRIVANQSYETRCATLNNSIITRSHIVNEQTNEHTFTGAPRCPCSVVPRGTTYASNPHVITGDTSGRRRRRRENTTMAPITVERNMRMARAFRCARRVCCNLMHVRCVWLGTCGSE